MQLIILSSLCNTLLSEEKFKQMIREKCCLFLVLKNAFKGWVAVPYLALFL